MGPIYLNGMQMGFLGIYFYKIQASPTNGAIEFSLAENDLPNKKLKI
jgi:hypothetical protein